MSERPTFSVIMPAYNTAGTVADSIRSVLSQTCGDFELIVVDDGSTDETGDVVEAFDDERIKLLRGPNRGAAAARNVGIGDSRGRLASFLDSDDLWMPTYLAAMRSALDARGGLGFAYTDAWTIDSETHRVGTATAMQWQHPPIPPPQDAVAFLLGLLKRNFVYNSVTVPLEVLRRVGPFREDLHAAIDYEMWLRLAAHAVPGIRPRGTLAVYRRGRHGSISTDRRGVLSNLLEVYRLVADEYDVPADARSLARRRAAVTRAELDALDGQWSVRGAWHARARPALVSCRNTVIRRQEWRARPPRELAESFPTLVAQPASGAISS